MAFITGATVTYTDYSAPGTPRFLNIPDAWGDVTAQDVWDTLSEIAAYEENLIYKKLVDRPRGGGKAELSATKSVGITLTMNNVQIKFPDQVGPTWVIKRVVDGNVVAIDHLEASMEAIASSDFTNWKNEADVSAAINETGVSGLTAGESAKLTNIDTKTTLSEQILRNKIITDPVTGEYILYDDDSVAELFRIPVYENAGGTIPYQGNAVNRKERLE